MEHDIFKHRQNSMPLPKGVWHLLAGDGLRAGADAIRIAAASPLDWPEFLSLRNDEIMFGKDGLFRLALWSASKCCAALLATRRATLLLSDGDGDWEIQCRVLANASLATHQPLSGFLLMPVEYLNRRTERRSQNPAPRADEIRNALLEAFPVDNDGENAP